MRSDFSLNTKHAYVRTVLSVVEYFREIYAGEVYVDGFVFVIISRPMGLNALGYQSHPL